MAWLTRLKRLLKLGLFVGAGAVSALASACGSSSSSVDAGVKGDADIGVQGDAVVSDMGAKDQKAQDTQPQADLQDAAGLDTGPPDADTGWDIPLE